MPRLTGEQCAGQRWRVGPGHVSRRPASEGADAAGPGFHVVCGVTELSIVDFAESLRDDA